MVEKTESEIYQILKPLTGKQFPVLADIYFDELRRHSHVIARWLTKTALTTSMALPAKQRLSASFADEIMRGNAPAEVWIDVADAELPCVTAITKTFPIINGNIPIGVRDCGDMCFRFCLQINHLLLRVELVTASRGANILDQNHFACFRRQTGKCRNISDFETLIIFSTR